MTSRILLATILAVVLTGVIGCTGFVPAKNSGPTSNSSRLQISQSSLPVGTIGAKYVVSLVASGGTPPYTWTLAGGTLPTGLPLTSSTGAIAGTPTSAGNFLFTAQVEDAKLAVSTAQFSLTISTSTTAPTIGGISPSAGPSGGGTLATISGSNFHPGAIVRFGSSLASAVQVVNSGLLKTVTPPESSGSVNVEVMDPDGQIATSSTAFTFLPSKLQISTNPLPPGSLGLTYSSGLVASGGTPPYSWTQVSGSLPAGLLLNSATGSISGKPTTAGNFSFSARVQDSASVFSSGSFSLKISAAGASPLPTVALTEPANGVTASGKIDLVASTTNFRSSIASLQFILDKSPLGQALKISPYDLQWDTTSVSDGLHTLSAVATDATGSVTMSAAVAVTVANSHQAWNPSVLGVSWAADFNSIAANEINVKTDSRLQTKAIGDGNADDTAAIRAAIQLASSKGGGLVYLPNGDYKIFAPSDPKHGNPLVVPSRVILRGDSSTASRIFVNDPKVASQTDGVWTWGGINFQGSSQSGMTDLGVYAVNSSSSPCALLWNRGSSPVSELFFNDMDVHLANCKNFWFESTDRLLVQNSRFDSNAQQFGPIYIVGNSHVSFLNNTITYNFGRVQMQTNTNLLMQGNTLTRDAENREMQAKTAIESGGVELSFGQNIQVLNNTVETLNAPADENNDGEAIMTQNSNIKDVLDVGSITAVTSTTLTDASALWGPVTSERISQFPQVVAILAGKATGQWRSIQGVNTQTKTLTVDQPWNPEPEVGSLFSIFVWTLMNATIQGNTLINNPNGIVLWDGCYNCVVQNNVLTNSRGIILRTADEAVDKSLYPEGRRLHPIAINSKILNNTVSNTSGVRPAYVALDTEAFDSQNYRGMGMMNIEVGGNILNVYAGNPNQNYQQNEISQEGYFPCFLFGPAAVKDPVISVFQNVNFWGNSQNTSVTYGRGFQPYTTKSCVQATAP